MFSCTSDDDGDFANHFGCLCHRPEIQSLTRRMTTELSRRGFVVGVGASIASLGFARRVNAKSAPTSSQPILFTNFRLFDGKSDALRDGQRLLVEGGQIKFVTANDSTSRVI